MISPERSQPQAQSSSVGWHAGSTARRIAERSRPEEPTVAVLGCGIDRDYPSAHAVLASRITEGGAVVSEYPPGVEPAPWRFPARNRIVAGLAAATVVVEARERSGALITADFALELGREVFAVPGEITSGLSKGTNDLIRQGATPLLAAQDVLEVLGLEPAPTAPRPNLSPEAAAVLVCPGRRCGSPGRDLTGNRARRTRGRGRAHRARARGPRRGRRRPLPGQRHVVSQGTSRGARPRARRARRRCCGR